MSTGVAVHDNCLDAFQDLKIRKKYKYILYKISDDAKEIILDKAVEAKDCKEYDDFISTLSSTDCRYAVYDFEFEKPGAGIRNKICFYSWIPDTARIKSKMIYAASKDALRKSLTGIAAEIQGTDFDEVEYGTVLEKLSRAH